MPSSKNLPSMMCIGCKFYTFKPNTHPHQHYCSDSGSFTNSTKVGGDPDKKGTANSCKSFKSR